MHDDTFTCFTRDELVAARARHVPIEPRVNPCGKAKQPPMINRAVTRTATASRVAFGTPRPWVGCRLYVSKGKFPPANFPHSASRSAPPPPKRTRIRNAVIAVGIVAAVTTAGTETGRDSVKHVYHLVQRVSVVTVATIRCFGIYKKVLDKEYADPHERREALSDAHKRAASITLAALEKNGGVYIKLGQHVSALTYLLPPEWTLTMIPLQDRCPRSSVEEIEEVFRQDTGRLLGETFSEFDAEPIGVASLAQVHLARMRDTGEQVAVKVQHLSLAEFVPIDIYMTQTVFSLMYKVFPEYPMTWLGDELQNSIYVELDFVNEAKNAEKTAEYFRPQKNLTALRIPKVVSAERRILIMECLSGARLDDLNYMSRNGILTAQVSSCLSHIFNTMIFAPGAGLHCDPHGGNLAIRAVSKPWWSRSHNFEIVLYDHGLYRYIPLQMKRDYAHLWLAILDNNVAQMRHYAERVAGVRGDRKFQIFAAAITGRDPEQALNYNISSVRTKAEMSSMQRRLQQEEGVLEDLMDILSSMPRMVLLILKTNDLTRNLDENLHLALGVERTFLILASYCARAVYDEARDNNSASHSRWSLLWIRGSVAAWFVYERRRCALALYDLGIALRLA